MKKIKKWWVLIVILLILLAGFLVYRKSIKPITLSPREQLFPSEKEPCDPDTFGRYCVKTEQDEAVVECMREPENETKGIIIYEICSKERKEGCVEEFGFAKCAVECVIKEDNTEKKYYAGQRDRDGNGCRQCDVNKLRKGEWGNVLEETFCKTETRDDGQCDINGKCKSIMCKDKDGSMKTDKEVDDANCRLCEKGTWMPINFEGECLISPTANGRCDAFGDCQSVCIIEEAEKKFYWSGEKEGISVSCRDRCIGNNIWEASSSGTYCITSDGKDGKCDGKTTGVAGCIKS